VGCSLIFSFPATLPTSNLKRPRAIHYSFSRQAHFVRSHKIHRDYLFVHCDRLPLRSHTCSRRAGVTATQNAFYNQYDIFSLQSVGRFLITSPIRQHRVFGNLPTPAQDQHLPPECTALSATQSGLSLKSVHGLLSSDHIATFERSLFG